MRKDHPIYGKRKIAMVNFQAAISLADTEMEVLNGEHEGYWSAFRAVVTMRLTPVPRVFMEATFDIPSSLLNYGTVVKVRLPTGPEIEARVVQTHGEPSFGSRLVPIRQPVTVMQLHEGIRCVHFRVINYPSLYREMHPAVLKADQWIIELRALPDLQETRKYLASESGFALTHKGTIWRSDGSAFQVGEAENILGALHLLLSFVRGGSCGLTLIAGNDENNSIVWQQWGSYSTFPWFSLSSWVDHRHDCDAVLSKAWPGFLNACQKTSSNSEDWFRIALYWYLRSNEANNPYVGIILTQAALERLAEAILTNAGREAHKWRRAEDKIRAAVQQIGVNPEIPKSCCELREVQEKSADGPTTLVKIRNDLVHPKMFENVSLNAYTEAQNLGQWYVELFLLWLIGYEGEYANRLAYGYEGKWTMVPVPWSRGKG